MSISNELRDASLRYECPNCHKPIVRNGSWFKSVSTFRCEACKTKLRLGYSAKLALFEHHAKAAFSGA
ncbi:hypothetical protein P9272_30315 [Mesorhizobium sp. WSM4976]|uniref:hypothetical protein n=1 Tax=Mesorhizobium sp. WSM4976 TaxID=3038549 RepID=UPI0024173ED9|nr:hypothetical protein [Mesorhizobium sp. WSM4976]MDG4897838.1 hypothetical protein [Mesorhizobium sp. WSM4976]